MSSEAEVQILRKDDPSKAVVVSLSIKDLPTLAPSSIRVRTSILALTANNLAYASSGTALHWWDTYQVPSSAPTPYNHVDTYGIVPAWGYANVVESTISDINVGSVIWGMFPTSTLPVDLQLVPAGIPGHWTETSPHRSKLMALYQRYMVDRSVAKTPSQSDIENMGLTALLRPTWQAGYLMNNFVFPFDPSVKPIHPLAVGQPWSSTDADIRKSVLFSLGAGSKTAISFAYQFRTQRPTTGGPLGLLEVSASFSTPELPSKFPTRRVQYDALTASSTISWINSLKPQRVVILDFGGRDNSVQKIHTALLEDAGYNSSKVTVLNIGKEMKLYSTSELEAGVKEFARLNKVQLNTSGIMFAAMKAMGEGEYFAGKDEAWEVFRRDEKGASLTKVMWGEGVNGDSGLEGGWRSLCGGRVEGGLGLAYKL